MNHFVTNLEACRIYFYHLMFFQIQVSLFQLEVSSEQMALQPSQFDTYLQVAEKPIGFPAGDLLLNYSNCTSSCSFDLVRHLNVGLRAPKHYCHTACF